MAVHTETIKLEDQVSPAAKEAQGKMDLLTKSLNSANSSLIKASALGDIAGYRKASKDAEALKASISLLDIELLKEVETAKAADKANAALVESGKKGAKDWQKAMTEANDQAKQGSKAVADDMAATIGVLEGLAAAAAVVVVAFGALIVKGAAFAIEASEAKNASIALFDALGGGVLAGEDVDDMLDGLRAKLGVTKDSLAKFSTEFQRMGINSQEALETLTTAAISAEALVKGGGDAFVKMQSQIDAAAESGQKLTIPFKKLTAQLGAMRLNVDDVAKQMGLSGKVLTEQLAKGTVDAKKFGDALTDAATAKGAGPLEALANSSANLGAMLKEYIGDLFEDLGPAIAPFMKQVKELFGIFESKTTPSGMALKAGIEGFFKNVFAIATKVVPYIKHFLLDVIIYGLKAYIALKPIISWFKEIAANQKVIDGFKGALQIIGTVLLVVGGVIATVIVFVLAMGAAVSALITGIVWLATEITNFLGSAATALGEWIQSAETAAYDFVAGLVRGIAGGTSQVIGAVTGLGNAAIGAISGVFDSHSPSKVMLDMGEHDIAGALGTGIGAGEDTVAAASSGVANASVKAMSDGASGAGAAASGSGGGAINVTVMIDGAGKSALEITEEMVASVFQRVALGAGV